ncbi:MAG: phage integrase N-terminal SAM-like domain-containing protein [bacterium]
MKEIEISKSNDSRIKVSFVYNPSQQSDIATTKIVASSPVEEGEEIFEDFRRKLLSRKNSFRAVKSYIYYNRDFLNFINKQPPAITNNDIKDYLLYLAEENQSVTSTLNQAVNALKFYYGTMLKKKFAYEVKRRRKDKKFLVVLSKEEAAKILSSVDNLERKSWREYKPGKWLFEGVRAGGYLFIGMS